MSTPRITEMGTAKVRPKRGTKEFFRDLHPFEPMDPTAPAIPIQWFVPGFLMEGKVNFMFGPEKAGKSRFLRWLLANMYLGGTLYDMPVKAPQRLLYLAAEEMPADITSDLMESVKAAGGDPGEVVWEDRITLVQAAGMRLDDAKQRAWIREEMIEGGYDMLLIDPLRRVHAAKENDNDEMAYICNAIRSWSNELGVTILVLHHTGKLREDDDLTRIATWSRGATDVGSVLDWATFLMREGPDRVLIRRNGRAAPRPPFAVYDHGTGEPWIEGETYGS